MNSYQNWNEAYPSYGTSVPVHSNRFKAFLHVGTTVLFVSQNSEQTKFTTLHTNLLIGRIVKTRVANETVMLELNIFVPFERSLLSRSRFPIMAGNLKSVPEVVQTLQKVEIGMSDIHDVCFIFSQRDIDTGNSFCEGIINAFYVRFRCLIGSHDPSGINDDDNTKYYWYPTDCSFNKNYGSCYISRMWEIITKVQKTTTQILNLRTQSQATCIAQKRKIDTTIEQWEYILDKSDYHFIKPHYVVNNRKEKKLVIYDDLSRQSYGTQSKSHRIRFETIDHIKSFIKIFGTTTILGIRDKAPKIGRQQKITQSSILNIVVGNAIEEEPFTVNTDKCGIDLIFSVNKNSHATINICVRYTSVVYQDPFERDHYMNGPLIKNGTIEHDATIQNNTYLNAQHNNIVQNEVNNNIRVNQMFQLENGHIFTVTRVTNDTVTALRFIPHGLEELELVYNDFEIVRNLIENYIKNDSEENVVEQSEEI